MENTGVKILIVEDDVGIREGLSELLEGEGYEVFLAENGKRGVEFLDSATPNLILLDLMMPVMDGRAFLDEFHNRPNLSLSKVPVILITAAGEKGAAGCNVSEVLAKPLDIEKLLDVISNYLKK